MELAQTRFRSRPSGGICEIQSIHMWLEFAPTDTETLPQAIIRSQVEDVLAAIRELQQENKPLTADALSRHTVLPIWNIMRAVECLEHPPIEQEKKISVKAALREISKDRIRKTMELLESGPQTTKKITSFLGIQRSLFIATLNNYRGVYWDRRIKTKSEKTADDKSLFVWIKREKQGVAATKKLKKSIPVRKDAG